jgi:5-formyltetrahydrofolate cyclo-ligase
MGVMPSHRLKRAKATLRRAVLAQRDALEPADRAARSAAIADRVLGLPELADARSVMAFWSFGSEVETQPIIHGLHADGARVVLPRIEDRDVVPVAYVPGDPVSETSFGALEPVSGEVVPAGQLDAVLTPGVAFDRAGFRVGYGGGFYDRLFRRTRPDVFRVAVAFALQVVEEVPHGNADLPVDAIVTEDGVIRCAGE